MTGIAIPLGSSEAYGQRAINTAADTSSNMPPCSVVIFVSSGYSYKRSSHMPDIKSGYRIDPIISSGGVRYMPTATVIACSPFFKSGVKIIHIYHISDTSNRSELAIIHTVLHPETAARDVVRKPVPAPKPLPGGGFGALCGKIGVSDGMRPVPPSGYISNRSGPPGTSAPRRKRRRSAGRRRTLPAAPEEF